MGNHFHLLLRAPEREQFLRKFEKGTWEEREGRLFDHLGLLYSRAYLAQLKAELMIMTAQRHGGERSGFPHDRRLPRSQSRAGGHLRGPCRLWSSDGEPVVGGRGAKKSQSGLVRALRGQEGHLGNSRAWSQGGLAKEYRKLLLAGATEQVESCSDARRRVHRKGMTINPAGIQKEIDPTARP
jgi:hypothetical protein